MDEVPFICSDLESSLRVDLVEIHMATACSVIKDSVRFVQSEDVGRPLVMYSQPNAAWPRQPGLALLAGYWGFLLLLAEGAVP